MSKKNNRHILAVILCLCVLAAAAVAFGVKTIQYRETFDDIRNDLSHELDILHENYIRALPMEQSTAEYNNQVYQSFVRLISEILTRNGEDAISDEALKTICKELSATNIGIIDFEGNLIFNAYPFDVDFTGDRFNQLKYVSVSREASDGFSVKVDGKDTLYYGYPLGKDRIVVLAIPAEELEEANEQAFGWANLLSNAHIGIDGFSMVGNPQDYAVLWAEDERLIGQSIIYMVKSGDITNDEIYTLDVFGNEYYAMNRYYEDTGISLITCISAEEVNKLISTPVIFITLIFALSVGFLSAFCLIQNTDKAFANARQLRKKLIPVAFATAAFMVLSTFYLQTLCSLSIGMMRNEANVSNIQSTIQKYELTYEKITERNNFCTQRTAELAAYTVDKFPDMICTEGLAKLADIAGCKEIRVYDKAGNTIACSDGKDAFSISDKPADQSYEFRRLLRGTNSFCQQAMMNENGDFRQFAGVALRDENGDKNGFIQVCVIPVQIINATENYSYEAALSSFATADETFTFATDKDEKIIEWYPSEALIGKNSLEYDLKESNFRDNFNGFFTVNGTRCFGSCKEDADHYIFVATPQDDVYKNRVSNVLLNDTAVFIMLMLLVLIIPSVVSRAPTAEQTKTAQTVGSAGTLLHEQWRGFDSGKKMNVSLRVVFVAISAVISLLYLFRSKLLNEGSVVKYVFDGRWETGINPFSVTACITLICCLMVAVMLIMKMLEFLSKALNPRGVTVCKLVGNFISVFSVFVGIYFCLSFFGVDTSTLLASAGIVSVVIGLGANKLISDILAGLAIVFDGEIKVGDWIETGKFEGVVREIGIRSTKLVDSTRRVHIVSNSEFGGIINTSVPDYKVKVYASVAFDESYEKLAECLEKERPDFCRRYPAVKEGPFLDGVNSLSKTGYEVRFCLICDGIIYRKMQRALNDEIRRIFIKYNIRRDPNTEFYVKFDQNSAKEFIPPEDAEETSESIT